MSRCHLSHLLPWDNLAGCYDLPAQLRDAHVSSPNPQRRPQSSHRRAEYAEQQAAYAAFILPARKRCAHFMKRFVRAIDELASTEIRKYREEDVLAVQDALTEEDRCEFPALFTGCALFDEHRELASWGETERAAEVQEAEAAPALAQDAQAAAAAGRQQGDREEKQPLEPVSRAAHYAALWSRADVLKFLILHQRTLPLLALLRRFPETMNGYRAAVLRNRICNHGMNFLIPALLRLYLHVNLAVLWGETVGRGRRHTTAERWQQQLGDSPYHWELQSWLDMDSPDHGDGGHDAALNSLIRPFLQLYTVRVIRGYPDTIVTAWTLCVEKSEEMCRRIFAALVTFEVWQRLLPPYAAPEREDMRGVRDVSIIDWQSDLTQAMFFSELGVAAPQ